MKVLKAENLRGTTKVLKIKKEKNNKNINKLKELYLTVDQKKYQK